jgi:DNA-directed RNA polymerase specialized sigma24 family protein
MEVKIDSLIYQDFIHDWIKKIKKKNPDRLPDNKLDLLYEDFDRVNGLKHQQRIYTNKYSPEDIFEIVDKTKYLFFKLKNNLDSSEFSDNFEEIENLIKEFFSELLAYMHKFTSNFTHAQESAQHSFTKLAKGKYSFKNLDTTKAWLKVVARNCLYTYYKRNNRYLLCEHSEFVSEDNNFKLIENSNGFNILVQSEEEASVKLDIKNSLNKLSKKKL